MAIPKLHKIKAVIFDFDGVIVDSEWRKFVILSELAAARGFRMKKSDYPLKIGKKESPFLRELFGKKIAAKQIRELVKQRRKHQLAHPIQYAALIPGIGNFLKFLKKQNIRLCVATGTTRDVTVQALRLQGMRGFFDCMVTGEEYRSSKPNPEVYRIALRKLRIKPREAFVIEDAPVGVTAAKRAGIPVVAITTTSPRAKLKKADLIVRSFPELRRKLC